MCSTHSRFWPRPSGTPGEALTRGNDGRAASLPPTCNSTLLADLRQREQLDARVDRLFDGDVFLLHFERPGEHRCCVLVRHTGDACVVRDYQVARLDEHACQADGSVDFHRVVAPLSCY